jgi:hypothetical protein
MPFYALFMRSTVGRLKASWFSLAVFVLATAGLNAQTSVWSQTFSVATNGFDELITVDFAADGHGGFVYGWTTFSDPDIRFLWFGPQGEELTFATDSSDVSAKSGEGSIPVRHQAHHARNDAGQSVDYRLQCAACAGCAERWTFRPRTSLFGSLSRGENGFVPHCCNSVSLWQLVYPAFFACAFGPCPRSC